MNQLKEEYARGWDDMKVDFLKEREMNEIIHLENENFDIHKRQIEGQINKVVGKIHQLKS